MQLHSRPFQVVIFCLALLPAFLTIWVILNYGVDVPYWDDWETAVLIDKFSQGALSPAHLFAKHNEYRQFFPNLIFVLLAWLTRWDLRYQMLVSFLMACVVSFNIYRLGQLTAGSESRRLIQFFLSNLLIFSPMQYENWLMGIQVVYFVPIVCITICLRIACSRLSDKSKFITCALLSAVSTFSSVNGILCWIVVLPVLLRWRSQPLKKTWPVFAWVAGTAISATLYSYGAERLAVSSGISDHPLGQVGRALVYFTAFLGGTLGIGRQPFYIAIPAGAALLVVFVLSLKCFLKHSTDETLARSLIVWLMLGTYSVLTAAMVTAGRIHYGVEQSLSSRYTTFSLYLMVSLVYLVPLILDRAPGIFKPGKREAFRKLATLAAIYLVVGHLVVFAVVIQHGAKPTWHERLHAKACLLLINVIDDDCGAMLYPNIEQLRQRASVIDGFGFLRPPLVRSDRVKDLDIVDAGNAEIFGSFDSLDNAGEDKRVASGWATLPDGKRPPDAIILAYQNTNSDFIMFALTDVEIEKRPTLDLLSSAERSRWRWQKSFPLSKLPTIPTKLNAWAFDGKTGRAYKLGGEKIVE